MSKKGLIVTQKGKSEFEYRKKRFLAEARTMAKFGAHRSIPNVFEFFEENNTAYIVMELLQGITLSEYIADNGGKIEVDFALMIINEVGNALNSLHKEGITHCDVAPDNIFLCNGKEIRVKLMDLGAARLKDRSDEVIDIILKPGYSPVEQYDNSKNIGPWTDIYSLGATFYMMITGLKPEESTNRKIADTTVPPAQMESTVSENLSNAIMKALAIDIHMRFKKIDEFLLAINGGKKVMTLAKERKHRRVRRFAGIAVALAVLAASAGLVIHNFMQKVEEGTLEPATISVWYSVLKDSTEHKAMEYVAEDFKEKFPDVQIELRAIPEEDYAAEISAAAQKGQLPDLFESTDLDDSVLADARSIEHLLQSEQAEGCLFLDQYHDYYADTKRLPLGIEVLVAYVITAGNTYVSYQSDYFSRLTDFGIPETQIAADSRYEGLVVSNFGTSAFMDRYAFMDSASNTSSVLLSSTVILEEFKTTLQGYGKKCVYPDTEKIYCDFTYEWSIGATGENELLVTMAEAEEQCQQVLKNCQPKLPSEPTQTGPAQNDQPTQPTTGGSQSDKETQPTTEGVQDDWETRPTVPVTTTPGPSYGQTSDDSETGAVIWIILGILVAGGAGAALMVKRRGPKKQYKKQPKKPVETKRPFPRRFDDL